MNLHNHLLKFAIPCVAACVAACVLFAGSVSISLAQEPSVSRILLIKLSREQSAVLCGSSVFTECMGFTKSECTEISEQAVQQCLMPLPETINLTELDNEAIEACPKKVFDDAGYKEDKALECLENAMGKEG